VAGQGDRRQVLHVVRQEARHRVGRYAAVLVLDLSHQLQVCETKTSILFYFFRKDSKSFARFILEEENKTRFCPVF
jgi:hypothetical protein